jgi:hypothetical protein
MPYWISDCRFWIPEWLIFHRIGTQHIQEKAICKNNEKNMSAEVLYKE